MESHLIYSASSHLKNIADWSEYIYCGVGDDTKDDIIENAVNEFFYDPLIYFVINRIESGEVYKKDVLRIIKKQLAQNDLIFWDTDFKKVLAFNHIGVMKKGVIQSKQ